MIMERHAETDGPGLTIKATVLHLAHGHTHTHTHTDKDEESATRTIKNQNLVRDLILATRKESMTSCSRFYEELAQQRDDVSSQNL